MRHLHPVSCPRTLPVPARSLLEKQAQLQVLSLALDVLAQASELIKSISGQNVSE